MSDYILKENSDGTVITLKQVQDILLEILVEFDRIINKYDLDYTLAFGSELGAIRHNGFIPWDDDIDVFMQYDDYLKLVSALQKELKPPFYFQCYEDNDKYNTLTPTMKIKIDDTYIKEKTLLTNRLEKNGLFIDIFVLDSISPSDFKHKLNQAYSIMLMPIIVALDLLKIDSRFFTKLLYNHGRKYADRNKDSEDAYLNISWTFEGLKVKRLKKKDVFPSKPHVFEDKMFRVSNNSHEVLKVKYGEDYMTLPPKEMQKPHHIEEISIER